MMQRLHLIHIMCRGQQVRNIYIFFSNSSFIFDFIFLCQFNFGMRLVFLPKYFRCNAIINVKISKFNPWPHGWPLIMFSLLLETNFVNDMLTMGCDLFWWSFLRIFWDSTRILQQLFIIYILFGLWKFSLVSKSLAGLSNFQIFEWYFLGLQLSPFTKIGREMGNRKIQN